MQASTSLDDAAMNPWRQDVLQIDGLTVRSQVGGQGPQVLLLHGWGEPSRVLPRCWTTCTGRIRWLPLIYPASARVACPRPPGVPLIMRV